ncbi:hypothetical protein [Bradyrhizobium erythrophlei]|uniref:Dolichyl-phosphate-mannose-protein mannosyltransferase n=1 Tax=Bradyrhizobium erythrophlei TaxID=1437360 RepID=A0A1M5UPI9_9BRAD|nr:hypothetical protein [Bradyrhizobium erythrophlei]SHH64870.1 hypothetical protein SAMN05444169_8560 [Bradyrhizobium erythrophlei]
MIFVQNVTVILSTLLLFTLCGWCVVAPFGRQIAFPAACAAFSGLLLLPCAALAIHVILMMTYWKATLVAGGALLSVSLLAVYVFGRQDMVSGLPCLVVAAIALSVCATLTVTRTDLFFGGPALLYANGTDQLGYANIADWIRMHVTNTALTHPPEDIYGSYPDYLFTRDPRFGSFSLLALVSVISGRSAAFAYDLTCAIALTAASIGVSAVFSRTRAVFLLLAAALFVSVWFDFGLIGYLGKIVGFPATILVVAMFFALCRLISVEEEFPLAALGALVACVICTVLMFNAQLTAVALGVFGSCFLVTRLVWEQRDALMVSQTARCSMILAALIVIAVVSSGVVARPLYTGFIPMSLDWKILADWAMQIAGPLGTTGPVLLVGPMRIIFTTVFVCICISAIIWKSPGATALVLGSATMAGMLYAFDERWRFYEISLLFVATPICAVAVLLNEELFLAGRVRFWIFFAVLLLTPVGFGLPRFVNGLSSLGGDSTPPLYRFSLEETDRMADVVASGAVIDVGEAPQFNIFLVVELGRRGIPFQVSEKSWRTFMGYRPWPIPHYDKPMPISIVLRSEANSAAPGLLMRTTQFDVMRRP